MTDKDPNDMTASEQLRLADSHPCSMCHLVMSGDESCATTGCASWAYRLADKIDAELVEARELSLRQGAELWAKANGWPDFKPSEDFGAWLDRCFIPRPLFEDGEPVQFGGDTDELDGVEKFIFLRNGGCCQMQDADGNICNVFHGKRVKRPAPEVLGADGLPIKVGETVWNTFSWHKGVVKELNAKALKVNGKSTAYVEWSNGRWSPCIRLDHLTHTPPETQERIDDDATMPPAEYCAVRGIDLGDDPDRETATEAMVLDLLRRQRELDKRTGGE